jgi:hypothetical protein
MRIEILDSAEKDLLDGFEFYERQSKGLGNYFLDSLFSDIESLYLCRYSRPPFWISSLAIQKIPLRHLLSFTKRHHPGLCRFGLPPESFLD